MCDLKKTFQSLLVLLVISLLCLPAEAKYSGGTGEPNNPYQIATAADLIALGETPEDYDKHFILTADIDLDPNLSGGQVFTEAVIAPDTNEVSDFQGVAFSGGLDGKGYKIRNLTVHNSSGDYLGLLGRIDTSGQVRNLGLEGAFVNGSDCMGCLAGSNSGTITNCYVNDKVFGGEQSSWNGGLVGANHGSIKDCHASVDVTAEDSSSMLGGLVGTNSGSIVNCYSTGNVSGGNKNFDLGGLVGSCHWGNIKDSHATGNVSSGDDSWCIGGLVGNAEMHNEITNCYSIGIITVGSNSRSIGGLVGKNWYGEIDYSYTTSSVTGANGSRYFGGLVGSNTGGIITDCYATGSISGYIFIGGLIGGLQMGSKVTNCYAVGRVSSSIDSSFIGGLVADITEYVWVNQCFWDIETSGLSFSASGTGLTTLQMLDIQTYQAAGWDMAGDRTDGTSDIWRIPEGGGYPELTIFSEDYQPHKLNGAGTPENPYQIATAEDLGAIFRFDRTASYKLVVDIDVTGITWRNAPIPKFDGIFDGSGHRIKNLTIQGGTTDFGLGLFGRIESGGKIQNLGLDNVLITGENGSFNLGGLTGSNSGIITNCYVTGRVSGGDDCDSLGGLVGSSVTGIIINCYATGSLSGGQACWSLGGLVGYAYESTITNCYAATSISVPIESKDIGGLVGSSTGGTSGCFWDIETSELSESAGGTGLTTAQLQDIQTYLDTGWDMVDEYANGTADLWQIPEGRGYPELTIFSEDYQLHELVGAGTSKNPYIIATAKDLSTMCYYNRSACYRLAADIDLSGSIWTTAPILDFNGEFNGAGFVISNFTIHGGNYIGLFGILGAHATIKNLGIEDANVASEDQAWHIGTLAGKSSATINNCYATGIICSGSYSRDLGGLVGYTYEGTITDCYSTSSVFAGENNSSVGGLVGENWFGIINRCYATGSVTGGKESRSLGGLVGTFFYDGIITDCYANGSVSGGERSGNLGGLVGDIYWGDIFPALGAINNCYASGTVIGGEDSSNLGGLIGSEAVWDDIIINCYFLDPADGGGPDNGMGVSLTDEQMKQQASFAGWDFVGETANGTEDIWWILEGQSYPRL